MMNAAMTAEAIGRLKFNPPSATGLLRKSPTVAPSGRERINAAQKRKTLEMLVQKYAAARTANPPANINAPYSYPVLSAIQSPSAVPSVCENVIATQ